MKKFLTCIFSFLFLSTFVLSNILPKLIPYRKGDKWGYCDSTKKIIVPCRFTSVGTLENGIGVIFSGQKFGFVDSNGKISHEAEFEYDHHRSFGSFEGNFIRLKKNGKCGLMNRHLKWVIPPVFDYLEFFSSNKIYADSGNVVGYLDTTGKVLFPFLYNSVYEDSNGFYVVSKKGKCGVIKAGGKVIIPFKYDQVSYAGEGIYCVTKDSIPGKSYPRYSGLMDTMGKEIRPIQFRHLGGFSSGLEPVSFNGKKWGYIDRVGKLVIDTIYDNAGGFSFNRAYVQKDGRYGYIDPNGKLITELKYFTWNLKLDRGEAFKNGFAIVECKGKWGVIDTSGKEILPCRYYGVWNENEDQEGGTRCKCFFVNDSGKTKMFFPPNKMVDAKTSQEPCYFPGGIRWERCDRGYDTLYYYLTIMGDTLNHRIYHKGGNVTWSQDFGFYNGYAIITENGKAGFIDRTGRVVVACKYNLLWKMRNDGITIVKSIKKVSGGTSEKMLGWIDHYGTEYWEE